MQYTGPVEYTVLRHYPATLDELTSLEAVDLRHLNSSLELTDLDRYVPSGQTIGSSLKIAKTFAASAPQPASVGPGDRTSAPPRRLNPPQPTSVVVGPTDRTSNSTTAPRPLHTRVPTPHAAPHRHALPLSLSTTISTRGHPFATSRRPSRLRPARASDAYAAVLAQPPAPRKTLRRWEDGLGGDDTEGHEDMCTYIHCVPRPTTSTTFSFRPSALPPISSSFPSVYTSTTCCVARLRRRH
ncbi:hypothetical protein C8F04DRAFT_1268017 [Mycena alexandri]|uniref:Uncharacterized protein n=1 Tax=Mycena alexandri TaxID=1745969 RepID=A0AAD6WV88_9AGAR|nr:hypothetical protein C8F04DRAFT_1268017 [Mycena alexandri]